MIGQYDQQQQNIPQGFGQNIFGQGNLNSGYGSVASGQAAFGQPFGQVGGSQQWSQRQLSPQDAGEIVRQLIPILPHIMAQAQQQPQAAFGGGFGQRTLTQQDVNEVVRQVLPVIAQLQGQNPMLAMTGGYGQQQPFGQQAYGNQFGNQQGWPQAAFGGGGQHQQRQLSHQDVNEVVRQLTNILPQVIQNLQATGGHQQRTM